MGGFGDIVMVLLVKVVCVWGVLYVVCLFMCFVEDGVEWLDDCCECIDVVIWCIGFCFVFDYLCLFGVVEINDCVVVVGMCSVV